MDYSEVEWNLYTLLFQRGRGLSNETPDRRRHSAKNACAIKQAHGQFLNEAHKGCVLLDVEHVPPAILIVFSYSWSSEKKRVRRRVRPCYLLQSQLSKEERSYHPLAVSFPSSFYSERYTSLQILMRWICCSTALCLRSLKKLLTYGFWIEWSGRSTVPVRTRQLCVGIPRKKSERALFFFSADWRKSMRAHNEKHRKKFAWP